MDLARTQRLYDWLHQRPLINLNGLCKECRVDRGNFVRGMDAGKGLKNVVVEKFEVALADYGYSHPPKTQLEAKKKPDTTPETPQPPIPQKEEPKPSNPFEAFTQRIDKCTTSYGLDDILNEVNKEKSFSNIARVALRNHARNRYSILRK